MPKKVTVTCSYIYEGDEKTDEAIIKDESDHWTSGNVSVEDIMAAGDCEFKVTVSETADAE